MPLPQYIQQNVGLTAYNAAPTQNADTAASFVKLTDLDQNTGYVGVQVTGTYSVSALTPRGTVDGLNWVALGPNAVISLATGIQSATIPAGAVGLYAVNVAGLVGFKLSAENSGYTGTAFVSVYQTNPSAAPPSLNNQLASNYVYQAASASAASIVTRGGFLDHIIYDNAGSSQAVTIYDNASAASGTILAVIPSGGADGTVFSLKVPFANGITLSGSANNPALGFVYY